MNLKTFAVEIRHSPWRLLYKPGKKEINNVEIYDAVGAFDQATGRLRHAAELLKAAAASRRTPAEQAHVEKLMLQLNQTFSRFNQVEAKFWKKVKR